MNEHDRAFFEDIATNLDIWVQTASSGVRDPGSSPCEARPALETLAGALRTHESREAFEAVIRETVTGVAHSIMVVLDGGSAYSDQRGSPRLLHADGSPFPEGLNEWLLDHLSRTGRLR